MRTGDADCKGRKRCRCGIELQQLRFAMRRRGEEEVAAGLGTLASSATLGVRV